MITENQKQLITEAVKVSIERAGGTNKFAAKADISPAMISHVTKGNWVNISDKTWRKLEFITGLTSSNWNIVETRPFKTITKLLADAQCNSLVQAIIAPAGSSKSITATTYANNSTHVFYVECADYWNKKTFLRNVLMSMGVSSDGMTVYDMVDATINETHKHNKPIIILDEADKLKDEVLYFFITLYNKLEDKCAIVLLSTNYLELRINKGLRNKRKGYEEIYSRLGRRFVSIKPSSDKDIAEICRANGIEEMSDITAVIDDSEYDLRRVKRKIHALNIQEPVNA